jgi:hypothetical protein
MDCREATAGAAPAASDQRLQAKHASRHLRAGAEMNRATRTTDRQRSAYEATYLFSVVIARVQSAGGTHPRHPSANAALMTTLHGQPLEDAALTVYFM